MSQTSIPKTSRDDIPLHARLTSRLPTIHLTRMEMPWHIPATVAGGACAAAAAWYAAGLAARSWCDARIRRETVGQGRLILSYDDGPNPATTPALLDLLAEHDARAVFFVVGRESLAHPELVDEIVARGHALGWHSMRHENQWKVGPVHGWRDLVIPEPLQRIFAGETRSLFRPPYGKFTAATLLSSWRQRLRPLTWTIDSGDTHPRLPTSESIALKAEAARGGCVLMHETWPQPQPELRCQFVRDLTERLLCLATRKSWEVVTPAGIAD